MIGSGYIAKFNRRIDPQAQPVGTFAGISKIMRNYNRKITYYIHWIDEFWYSFGKYYPHIGGLGISVARNELEATIGQPDPWIVIIMPYKQDVRFYGLQAMKWFRYCDDNNTWNNHSAIGGLQNGSIPIKLLINLEEHKP